jgi:hypothetical protein
LLSKAKMSRCTGPSARAIRSLSQGDPPARNCSSGEGRADSTGKEQRRKSTQAKNVRCEVECSTVRGLLFQAPLRKLDCEVPKKLAQKGKNLRIVVRRISISHSRDPDPVKHLPDRQTVAFNVAFYCSILPIYMNLYGAIWSYLPRNSRTPGGPDHSDMLGGQRFGPSIAHHFFVTNVHADAGFFFDPQQGD